MNASQFDTWVKEERKATEEKKETPAALEAALISRLQQEQYTYENTIIHIVYAWRNYEAISVQGNGSPSYTNTLQFIDNILQYVEQRIFLKARLQSIKGSIYLALNELEPAAEWFREAVDHLHVLHLDVDVNRIYNMTIMGQALLRMNNKENAEKLFLDVLSYPWYLVQEPDTRITFREYYITAAIGLIECRRGNAAALRNIFFVPATQHELAPILEQAIRDAELL